jgi:hypothetical protein
MAGINPFAKRAVKDEVDMRSHWDRLPSEYQRLCEEIAPRLTSPQNRRVRFAADMFLARKRQGN